MISVIMSTYKEEENLIRKSIESILNQTYTNFEYIIILDNPDNHIHERVIEEYAAKDARIQFLINKDEHGRTIALNRAINLAKGEYIAIMDADDIALPNRFSDELEYIEKYNYDLIGGITQVIDEEGNDLYGIKKIPSNPKKINKCLKYGQVIAHPTWLGKTEVFKAINGYRPMPLCEDYDFTLRAALKGFKISNINKPVLKYRMTANSVSRSNLFEQYLLASANKKTVLTDLLQLKEEKDIENYNKLLVTLSLEFLGDYQNAKDLYNQIELNSEEKEEYKSITAIIETFINKENSSKIIDELIANSPEDEYLRFAILSFFQNNETDISNEEEIKIISSNINETIKLNGMTVKTYVVNNKELDTIKFETNSNDIIVRYYYQTLLENIESENVSEDISIKITGNLKKNSTIYLQINCNDTEAKELRIALPNSLRLANTENLKGYWIMNNAIDYISVYKQKGYSSIKIPLIVTLDGNYKFENIVNNQNGIYHISNSLDLDIK